MKFNEVVKQRVLAGAAVGMSTKSCAELAGVTDMTVYRWLERGERELKEWDGESDLGAYGQFYADFRAIQAGTRQRALQIVHREMENKPELAWKYIERREKGFEPPAPAAPERQTGPVTIQLTLHGGAPVGALEPSTVIDVTEGSDGSDGHEPASATDAGEVATVHSLADRSSDE